MKTKKLFLSPPDRTLKSLRERLLQRGETLSAAESMTGGMLCEWATHLSGASGFFKGGIVAYYPEVKENVLRVDPQMMEKEGVVSEPVARAMAQGVKALLKTDWSLAVTGIAGLPNKKISGEAGKTAFALCSPFAYKTCIRYFKGGREETRCQAALFALNFLLSELTRRK